MCRGHTSETFAHQHRTFDGVAVHLEIFLAHVDARRLVAAVGIVAINKALLELTQQGELRNRAGWITWRATELAKHRRPQ